MTDLFAQWVNQPSAVELERVARKVALVSSKATQARLNANWRQYSTSRARGYLRARARRVVIAQTATIVGPKSDYTTAQVEGIVARAIELTADRLQRQRQSDFGRLAVAHSA